MSMPYYTDSDVAVRMKSERERLCLSPEQFAVLAGIDSDTYAKLEDGRYFIPTQFVFGLAGLGCDVGYIGTGERASIDNNSLKTPPSRFFSNLGWPDEDFRYAVHLMLRSAQAVEAFMGKGQAEKSPVLVAALMQATLDSQSCPGEREVLIDKVTNAIGDLTEVVSEMQDSPD